VAVGPTVCLELAGPLPWLPRPAACVSCALCVLVCPAGALVLAAAEQLETDLPD
jgi:formate hydrogenlyase subunit 6/NADH:ubiquinone oxidoreductase subunit I